MNKNIKISASMVTVALTSLQAHAAMNHEMNIDEKLVSEDLVSQIETSLHNQESQGITNASMVDFVRFLKLNDEFVTEDAAEILAMSDSSSASGSYSISGCYSNCHSACHASRGWR